MKDNFDLKKFLVENKSIENLNPFLKEEESREERADVDKFEYEKGKEAGEKTKSLQERIREMIINELGGDPELDYEGTSEEEMYGDYDNDEESYYQHSHQTDIDLEEMGEPEGEGENGDEDNTKTIRDEYDEDEFATIAAYLGGGPFEESLNGAKEDEEESWIDPAGGIHDADEDDPAAMYLEEAKEDEEEEEVEAEEEEVTDEEGGEEEEVDVEAEEEVDVETGGGLEDIAADMEGNEGDLMDHLISALKVSKGMDNEKLTTQIGNTLKFFVGEYIGGEE